MRAFRIAYDGRPFYGFQRQPAVPTVEGEILDALRTLGVLQTAADTPPGYAAAGRTDRRVSAVAQTIAFEAPDWLTPRALNGDLPGSIRAWADADAPSNFHATHDAASRTYTYHLHAPTADIGIARDGLAALSGEHDFHNLTSDDRNTVRTLDGIVKRDGEFLVLCLRAGGFSRQLVRRIVTLVEQVATGTTPLATVERILGSEARSGSDGIGPSPATPLVLTGVTYPNLDFRVDDRAATSARAVFEEKRIEAATAARVAGDVHDRIDSSE